MARSIKKTGTKAKQATRGVGRPPKQLSGDDAATRRAILDAALRSFSVHGFDGISIATIAKQHGVSSALIHYYFGNKDELWRGTIEHGVGNMIRDLADIIEHLEDVDSVSRLKFFIRRYITLAAERSDVFRLILRESDTPGERLQWLATTYLSPLYRMVCDLVEAAQKDGKIKSIVPPYHLAQIIIGACYHFLGSRDRLLESLNIDIHSREIRDLHAAAVIDILFNGMQA